MFKQLQQIGKAFMLPIAILPAAGLLLGIGGHYPIKPHCKPILYWIIRCCRGFFKLCPPQARWSLRIWHYFFASV